MNTILIASDTHRIGHSFKLMPKADLFIHLGDLTTYGMSNHFYDVFSNLSTEMPFMYLPGNHDTTYDGVLNRIYYRDHYSHYQKLDDRVGAFFLYVFDDGEWSLN